MNANFGIGGTKIQPLYILWVLENYTDSEHTLKQDEIVRILKEKGYTTERKSVAKDLKMLRAFGYKIHGVDQDENSEKDTVKQRGKIWLEREISDEKLQLYADTVRFSRFIGKDEAKGLIDNINQLGSPLFRSDKPEIENTDETGTNSDDDNIFEVLNDVRNAIRLGKKVRFESSKLKLSGNQLVLENSHAQSVSPYFLVPQNGNYYLVGYNHRSGKILNYRIDYIKNLKILTKEELKPKEETLFATTSIDEYVIEHPLMFSGEVIDIEVRVASANLRLIKDTFGSNYKVLSEEHGHLILGIRCGEMDALFWAMQYGEYAEVIAPQSLRNKIRTRVEGMFLKYCQRDGDRLEKELDMTRRGVPALNLSGVTITNPKKLSGIPRLTILTLSDNRLEDMSFISQYKNIKKLTITNNPVKDLSVIGELKKLEVLVLKNLPNLKDLDFLNGLDNLKEITLDLERTVDCTGLNKIKDLEKLVMSEKFSHNESIDWEFLKNNPKIDEGEIVDRPYEREEERNVRPNWLPQTKYPQNILTTVFGFVYRPKITKENLLKGLEELLDKLLPEEKSLVEMAYKEKLNLSEMASRLNFSEDRVSSVLRYARQKMRHPSYNQVFDKYIEKEENEI